MFGLALLRVKSDVATQIMIALLRKSLQLVQESRNRRASCKVCKDLVESCGFDTFQKITSETMRPAQQLDSTNRVTRNSWARFTIN
jgi:hypothetical protein